MPVHVIDHPLLADVLARLRDRETSSEEFRALSYRATVLLVAAATADLPTAAARVRTPLAETGARRLSGRVVAVPVLRAGLGMLEAFLDLVTAAEVGYFGLERDERTAVARCYYEKMPARLGDALVFLLDPMLATGGSAVMALEGLRARGAREVRFLSVVAAPEGVARLSAADPEVSIYTAAVDERLDEHKYIVPGLGDFGDRLFGTT